MFNVIWTVVLSSNDQNIFDASGDVELSIEEKTNISSIEPSIYDRRGRSPMYPEVSDGPRTQIDPTCPY